MTLALRLPPTLPAASRAVATAWRGSVTILPPRDVLEAALGHDLHVHADDARGTAYRVDRTVYLVRAADGHATTLRLDSDVPFSVSEVAAAVGCARSVVVAACRRGDLRSVKVGHMLAIRERDAATWRPRPGPGWQRGRARK